MAYTQITHKTEIIISCAADYQLIPRFAARGSGTTIFFFNLFLFIFIFFKLIHCIFFAFFSLVFPVSAHAPVPCSRDGKAPGEESRS